VGRRQLLTTPASAAGEPAGGGAAAAGRRRSHHAATCAEEAAVRTRSLPRPRAKLGKQHAGGQHRGARSGAVESQQHGRRACAVLAVLQELSEAFRAIPQLLQGQRSGGEYRGTRLRLRLGILCEAPRSRLEPRVEQQLLRTRGTVGGRSGRGARRLLLAIELGEHRRHTPVLEPLLLDQLQLQPVAHPAYGWWRARQRQPFLLHVLSNGWSPVESRLLLQHASARPSDDATLSLGPSQRHAQATWPVLLPAGARARGEAWAGGETAPVWTGGAVGAAIASCRRQRHRQSQSRRRLHLRRRLLHFRRRPRRRLHLRRLASTSIQRHRPLGSR